MTDVCRVHYFVIEITSNILHTINALPVNLSCCYGDRECRRLTPVLNSKAGFTLYADTKVPMILDIFLANLSFMSDSTPRVRCVHLTSTRTGRGWWRLIDAFD